MSADILAGNPNTPKPTIHSVWNERKNDLFWARCFIYTDAKSRHLEVSRLTDFESREANLIFQKPLVCYCIKSDSL